MAWQKIESLAEKENLLNDPSREVMVMQEMETPRQAYLLKRGQYDKHGEKVFPNMPAIILPFKKQYPKNRLGLAKWLTDSQNPLTARVMVNRYWQLYFGKGIVGTVALKGQPEIVADTSKDKRYILDDAMRFSELAVPIILQDKVIGVIDSEHPQKNFYTQEHLEVLTTIALMSATRIKSAMAQEKLNQYQNELENLVALRTAELNKVIHQLKNANADLENYAYAASHDLQEPLRTISGFLKTIRKRENNLSKESKEFMDYAIDGTKRMKQLLESTLAYARIGSVSHKTTLVDLNKVLQHLNTCYNIT